MHRTAGSAPRRSWAERALFSTPVNDAHYDAPDDAHAQIASILASFQHSLSKSSLSRLAANHNRGLPPRSTFRRFRL